MPLGHDVKIAARDKEVTLDLLDAYKFEYRNLGKHYRGLFNKAFGMLRPGQILPIAGNSEVFSSGGRQYSHI